MTDIPKQIEYWVRTSEEDFEVGKNLVLADKTRHGLFFINLAIEKLLKACVCKNQGQTPPKIHNLLRLAELAEIKLDKDKFDSLGAINRFCLEGRYPEQWTAIPDKEEVKRYLKISNEILKWLKQQL